MHTPWGKSDHSRKVTRGIMLYETPSHGGYHVSPGMLAKMPECLRNADGWYEEDVEWAKVCLAFPEFFREQDIKSAKISLRMWNWKAYEEFYSVVLLPGESPDKDDWMKYHSKLVLDNPV